MSKLVIITLKSRKELIGEDSRFKIKTQDFEGSYTNTLALGLGKALIVDQDDNGNFTLSAMDEGVTPIRIHKSWASTVDYPIQLADDLVAMNDNRRVPQDTDD